MSAPVTASRQDGVLVVRLANPAARNAIDMPFATALHEILSGLPTEGADAVGAIALLSDGDQFCVGGNVREMAAATERAGFVQALADELHHSMRLLSTAPPVVVGVQGWAAGAGMSLVCAGDVVIAAQNARFQPAYPGIGVTPDGGMSWNLPRIVGERRARSIILRNLALDAEQARELGLVDEIVPLEQLESTVLTQAAAFANGPRTALAGIKRLVNEAASRSYGEHLDAEAASISARASDPDGQEGLAAFVERRTPVYGR